VEVDYGGIRLPSTRVKPEAEAEKHPMEGPENPAPVALRARIAAVLTANLKM